MNSTNISFKRALRIFVFLSVALTSIFCSKKTAEQSTEKILARIGDKTISVDEFVRRAELAIRPAYCRGNDSVHKKIILNTLIAEKLLALEAGKNNELAKNELFQGYLKGRKEQAMRQWLYFHDFYDKVKLDTNEIRTAFKLAGRKYDIAYFTIKDSTVAGQVQEKLQKGFTFREVFQQLEGSEEIPRREVSWNAPEHAAIHKGLFSRPLQKDQVIGPIKIEKNFYTVIKILGWTDQLAVSNSDVQKRLNDVKKKLKEENASARFREYVGTIMRGRRVVFAKESFHKLVNIFGTVYMKSRNTGILNLNQGFWVNDSNETGIENLEIKIKKLEHLPLLRIDNETWSVGDLKKEMLSHPLVFRKKRMRKNEFAGQLKFAVVDLIRDKYITQEAYRKGYDKANTVERNVSMWRDYLTALYQRNKYLKSIGRTEDFYEDYLQIIEQDLTPYIDRLQEKYKNVIEINTNLLKDVQLTRIDLFVLKKDVPYPVVVPSFPLLTTDNKIDYGRKTE